MAKRNPNGYGCVTKLSGNRSRPYVVKVTVYDSDGFPKQIPVGYAETKEKALILLAQYNNNPWEADRETVTLADLFQRWAEVRLPKLGESNIRSLKAAYKHLSKYYGMKYRSIRSYHMQEAIDSCTLSCSTQGNIKNLWGHLDRFAFECDIIDKMYSQLVSSPTATDTKRVPFSAAEIQALWDISDRPYVDTVLIYLYTGFRLNELLSMKTEQVNLEEKIFTGGSKTSSGKNRVVPIHPRIEHFVKCLMSRGHEYFFTIDGKKLSADAYYSIWGGIMKSIGAHHTPHEARHTFETNLDNAGGNRRCIDLLMGHRSKDIGNRVYNHKTLDQLRETINLLK